MPLQIKGLQKLSLIDYPDKLCATIFLGHCNFRCAYCYNVDLVMRAEQMTTITESWVLDFLQERQHFLDGLCVGGGEPTIHKDLPRFLTQVKDIGYSIKIDTNGSQPDMLQKLIDKQVVDYFAMDIKAPFHKYTLITRTPIDIEPIKESVELLKTGDIDYEFRTTVVPDFLSLRDIIEIATELQSAKRYVLQQFIPGRTLDDSLRRQYSIETLKEIQAKVRPFFQECLLRS